MRARPGPARRLDHRRDRDVLRAARARREERVVVVAVRGGRPLDRPRVLGVHEHEAVEVGEQAQVGLELVGLEVPELLDPECSRKHLNPNTPASHRGRSSSALPGTAPPQNPTSTNAWSRATFCLVSSASTSTVGDRVERHVDDRRHPARGGGPRRGREALPLGAPRLVDVHVRVDEPGTSTWCGSSSTTRAVEPGAERLDRADHSPTTPTSRGTPRRRRARARRARRGRTRARDRSPHPCPSRPPSCLLLPGCGVLSRAARWRWGRPRPRSRGPRTR